MLFAIIVHFQKFRAKIVNLIKKMETFFKHCVVVVVDVVVGSFNLPSYRRRRGCYEVLSYEKKEKDVERYLTGVFICI